VDDFSSIIIPLLIICFLIFGHFEKEGDPGCGLAIIGVIALWFFIPFILSVIF